MAAIIENYDAVDIIHEFLIPVGKCGKILLQRYLGVFGMRTFGERQGINTSAPANVLCAAVHTCATNI